MFINPILTNPKIMKAAGEVLSAAFTPERESEETEMQDNAFLKTDEHRSYHVLDICDYIIRTENKNERFINPLKLNHLLYFVKALFASQQNRNLFFEKMYAEDFGAIIPEVYWAFKCFGNMDVMVYDDGGYMRDSLLFGKRITEVAEIDSTDAVLIDEVLGLFADYSASAMLSVIHNQAPWKTARHTVSTEEMFCKEREITTESMRDYFKESEENTNG